MCNDLGLSDSINVKYVQYLNRDCLRSLPYLVTISHNFLFLGVIEGIFFSSLSPRSVYSPSSTCCRSPASGRIETSIYPNSYGMNHYLLFAHFDKVLLKYSIRKAMYIHRELGNHNGNGVVRNRSNGKGGGYATRNKKVRILGDVLKRM